MAALASLGPRDRGLSRITARLLLAATRGELEDRWFKTASDSERVALQSLLKQRVLPTLPGQTEIIPAPEVIYGLNPDLREPPPLGVLSLLGAGQKTIPGTPTQLQPSALLNKLATPD